MLSFNRCCCDVEPRSMRWGVNHLSWSASAHLPSPASSLHPGGGRRAPRAGGAPEEDRTPPKHRAKLRCRPRERPGMSSRPARSGEAAGPAASGSDHARPAGCGGDGNGERRQRCPGIAEKTRSGAMGRGGAGAGKGAARPAPYPTPTTALRGALSAPPTCSERWPSQLLPARSGALSPGASSRPGPRRATGAGMEPAARNPRPFPADPATSARREPRGPPSWGQPQPRAPSSCMGPSSRPSWLPRCCRGAAKGETSPIPSRPFPGRPSRRARTHRAQPRRCRRRSQRYRRWYRLAKMAEGAGEERAPRRCRRQGRPILPPSFPVPPLPPPPWRTGKGAGAVADPSPGFRSVLLPRPEVTSAFAGSWGSDTGPRASGRARSVRPLCGACHSSAEALVQAAGQAGLRAHGYSRSGSPGPRLGHSLGQAPAGSCKAASPDLPGWNTQLRCL